MQFQLNQILVNIAKDNYNITLIKFPSVLRYRTQNITREITSHNRRETKVSVRWEDNATILFWDDYIAVGQKKVGIAKITLQNKLFRLYLHQYNELLNIASSKLITKSNLKVNCPVTYKELKSVTKHFAKGKKIKQDWTRSEKLSRSEVPKS